MVIKTRSDKETQELGEKLGRGRKNGKKRPFLCLYGELGTGKTTFVRGLAKGLGIHKRISSPTFTYQRIYSQGAQKLYHFDCYRLARPDALFLQEIYEAFERKDGVVAIEWADRIAEFLPKERTDIYLEYENEKTRRVEINTNGKWKM